MFDRYRLRKVGWLALTALLALFCPLPAAAVPAASPPPKAPPGFVITYTKELRMISAAGLPWQSSVKFKKEPAYLSKVVQRATAMIGTAPNQRPLGFAWDVAAGKLYVDANGNLDLTDDPPAGHPEVNYGQTRFTNIALEVPMGTLKVPTLCNFFFYTDSNINYPQLEVLTGWSGTWTIDGVSHHIEVVDRNLDGRFDTTDGFLLDESFGSSSLPGAIVLGGLPYDLTFKPIAGQPNPSLECAVAPHPGPAGVLNLAGKSIESLYLNGSSLVLVAHPGPVIRLPQGHYNVASLDLKSTGTPNTATAIHWTNGYAGQISTGDTSFTVRENEPATLKMGGPLAASIEAVPDGDIVRLSYTLVGNGGEHYPPNLQGVPPGFEVYKGDRKIAAGKFEFG